MYFITNRGSATYYLIWVTVKTASLTSPGAHLSAHSDLQSSACKFPTKHVCLLQKRAVEILSTQKCSLTLIFVLVKIWTSVYTTHF